MNRQGTLGDFIDVAGGSGTTLEPRKRQAYTSKRLQELVSAHRQEQKRKADDSNDGGSSGHGVADLRRSRGGAGEVKRGEGGSSILMKGTGGTGRKATESALVLVLGLLEPCVRLEWRQIKHQEGTDNLLFFRFSWE